MLLSSAFPCDKMQSPIRTRSAALFASPPASPPNMSTDALGLASACFSLQSLISTPSASDNNAPTLNELPTPPMSHRPSPLKLRLRSHNQSPTKRITKRTPARGANKRRRDVEDDMGRDDVERYYSSDSETEHEHDSEYTLGNIQPVPFSLPGRSPRQEADLPPRPTTPKQSRIAPPEMPLGLERTDFHGVQQEDPHDAARLGTGIEVGRDGEAWSMEQDSKLIELLVSKFKLSQEDLADCARSLGKGSGYVERRWKSLVANGDIGLKKRARRTRLHSTWSR